MWYPGRVKEVNEDGKVIYFEGIVRVMNTIAEIGSCLF